jgi:hypothetical protein
VASNVKSASNTCVVSSWKRIAKSVTAETSPNPVAVAYDTDVEPLPHSCVGSLHELVSVNVDRSNSGTKPILDEVKEQDRAEVERVGFVRKRDLEEPGIAVPAGGLSSAPDAAGVAMILRRRARTARGAGGGDRGTSAPWRMRADSSLIRREDV